MKRLGGYRCALGCALLAFIAARSVLAEPAADPSASRIPSPVEVLSIMERVADWQLAHPAQYPDTDWTQAAGDIGMMALARISASPRFAHALLDIGASRTHWQLGPHPYVADDHAIGQMYAELFLQHRDPEMIAPLRERFDWILEHPKGGSLEFVGADKADRWAWCDSLFMGPPTWVRLYVDTGERAYLDYAVVNWWRTSDYLYDRKEHLYFRDSTYFPRKEANGRKVFWSRGNGWVLAGLARVLDYLPAHHPARGRFVRQFREMAEKVRSLQQPDGFWRVSLLDPSDYPLQETSGTGFFTFALAWGINHHLLDAARFTPIVAKGWAALAVSVTPDGKLTHVQPIGQNPVRFSEENTEPFGVGALLLAGSEVYGLGAPSKPSRSSRAYSQPQ